MEISERTPDEHLASLSEGVRADIQFLDAEISKRMPVGAERVIYEGKLWGGTDQNIIGYGKFGYTNSSGKTVEWFMVGLAAQKRHISVYINAVDDDGYLVPRYKDRLGKAKVGSASIGFKSLADIDLGVLMELVDMAASQTTD